MTTPAIAAAAAPQLTQLRPPPPFDFDNPGSWTTWLLQYEDYTFATGHYTAPPEVQVRSMLYCMGPQARASYSQPRRWVTPSSKTLPPSKKRLPTISFIRPTSCTKRPAFTAVLKNRAKLPMPSTRLSARW